MRLLQFESVAGCAEFILDTEVESIAENGLAEGQSIIRTRSGHMHTVVGEALDVAMFISDGKAFEDCVPGEFGEFLEEVEKAGKESDESSQSA